MQYSRESPHDHEPNGLTGPKREQPAGKSDIEDASRRAAATIVASEVSRRGRRHPPASMAAKTAR